MTPRAAKPAKPARAAAAAPPRETRILLIEDNTLLREGITDVLQTQGGFHVVALADGGDTANALAGMRSPDVILLDLGLEQASSLELMLELRERFPDARVVAMDIIPEQDDIVAFVKAGGCGFILKNATVADYVRTIRAVAGGATVLPAMLTKPLFAQIVESAIRTGGVDLPARALRLTAREREVVDLISEGMSNKDIAQHLHIATYTVKSHVHNVLEKLELHTRLQIAAFTRDALKPGQST